MKMKSPAVVSKILTQQSSQLTQSVGAGVSDGSVVSRQVREAEFLQRVQKTAKEERANRLRWSVLQLNSMYTVNVGSTQFDLISKCNKMDQVYMCCSFPLLILALSLFLPHVYSTHFLHPCTRS